MDGGGASGDDSAGEDGGEDSGALMVIGPASVESRRLCLGDRSEVARSGSRFTPLEPSVPRWAEEAGGVAD